MVNVFAMVITNDNESDRRFKPIQVAVVDFLHQNIKIFVKGG